MAIKETKDMLYFVLALGNAAGKSLEDGRVGLFDLVHFFKAFQYINEAIQGIEKIPSELKDLNAEEVAELKKFVAENFDIKNDEIEDYVESGLNVSFEIAAFIAKFFKADTDTDTANENS